MQVGLAVDNIKGIRKNAKFKREVAQVKGMRPPLGSTEMLFSCFLTLLCFSSFPQVKVLLTLMSSRVFFRLLVYCTKRNPVACSGHHFVKRKGKVYTTVCGKLKHRVSNLFNYAWKPEDVPKTEFLVKNNVS